MTQTAHLVDARHTQTVEVLGPTVEFLTPLDDSESGPCVMRGTIPPGVLVPLHSHADPETFFMVAGKIEGLVVTPEAFTWTPITPGDVFHVPRDAKHAFRNRSRGRAVMIIASTTRIARFFREVGDAPGTTTWPPPEPAVQRFLDVAERYGYWNATPEENAQVGIDLLASAV